MGNERIFYFDGNSARSSEVRVLFFNEAINIYDAAGEHFIGSYLLKGLATNVVGENYFVYLNGAGTLYLQFTKTNPLSDTISKEIANSNDTWLKKLMKQKIVVLLTMLVVLIVSGYLLLVNLIPFLGSKMISRDMEIKMGNNLKQLMIDEARLMGAEVDTTGTKNLQAFADKIKLSSEYPIRMTLVKSDLVNAFALPGGQVIVYSGMLKKISNAETLVALLAHESTHVNERHSLRSLLRSAANGILISIVFNDATGVSAALVSNAETLNGLYYSRSLETEADHKGMDLMISNGVDAKGMQQLMNLLKEEGDVPESLSFISTHPLTEKRINATETYINEHPRKISKRNDLEISFSELKRSE